MENISFVSRDVSCVQAEGRAISLGFVTHVTYSYDRDWTTVT